MQLNFSKTYMSNHIFQVKAHKNGSTDYYSIKIYLKYIIIIVFYFYYYGAMVGQQ